MKEILYVKSWGATWNKNHVLKVVEQFDINHICQMLWSNFTLIQYVQSCGAN